MTLNHNCGCFSGVGSGIAGNVRVLGEEAEKHLAAALNLAQSAVAADLKTENYAQAMAHLSKLRAPLDAFFETR
nr:hypothetical protein [uncultured Flavobacterium sp.]